MVQPPPSRTVRRFFDRIRKRLPPPSEGVRYEAALEEERRRWADHCRVMRGKSPR